MYNRNHKLVISTAPTGDYGSGQCSHEHYTKAKSREPAYSQALIQTKINRQRVRSREPGKQVIRWL